MQLLEELLDLSALQRGEKQKSVEVNAGVIPSVIQFSALLPFLHSSTASLLSLAFQLHLTKSWISTYALPTYGRRNCGTKSESKNMPVAFSVPKKANM